MNIASTISRNGVAIRLTEERWKHIYMMHPSLADRQGQVVDSVKNPDYIFRGKGGELLAVSAISNRGYIVVVYKEVETDGFIIN